MRKKIDRAIERREDDDLISTLHGAKASDIQYAARRLAASDGDGARSPGRLAATFSKHGAPAARALACHLIPRFYETDPEAARQLLDRFLADGDRAVHEAAATCAGRLLRRDFSGMLDHIRAWRENPSALVRRGAAVAAGRAADFRHPEWAEPLLKLLAGLLGDRDPQVRRALGPSALGASLLRHYPRIAFEYLTQWSTSNDPYALWNVAMALSAPPAADIAKKALIILRKLSLDERHLVWRAVASAMWKLGRKCPEVVRPELGRWIEDERRTAVAREALNHL